VPEDTPTETDMANLPNRPRLKMVRRAALVAVLLIAGGTAWLWQPSIAPAPPPPRSAFAPEQIVRGATLAAVGDCAVCHTTSGGHPYAGGRGVPTPFGIIYATNITPDPETGIGAWSEDAFRRAMRDGISRDGTHLYPVLPYPHFTRATDEDIAAIYAFLMTRPPVRQATPPNHLPFPLNHRMLLAGWNLLYLQPGVWQPDPTHDAEWNRGAYLTQAIGHCGACHTPHNAMGAERRGEALSGGVAEDWYAPPLQASSPAGVPWTQEALSTYLRTGFQAQHGAAAGPMTAVTDELAAVPDADIGAIATYIASGMPTATRQPDLPLAGNDPAAHALFAGACGGCHGIDAPMILRGAPRLTLGTAVNAPTPQGVIEMILNGIPAREGKAAPYMPGFAAVLTDAQIADLAAYLRATYSSGAPWQDLPNVVAKARQNGGAS
jgi:mono/diheme cytochrome c family protein